MTTWIIAAFGLAIVVLSFLLHSKMKKLAKLKDENYGLQSDCASLKVQLTSAHNDLDIIKNAYKELKDVEERKIKDLEAVVADLPEKGDSQSRLDILNGSSAK